jgi:vacuolar-type H+-ATPase subunit F/Vma7
MTKVKVVNNIHGGLGFFLNPTPESFRLLPKQGAFLEITDEEVQYIHINQEIIQKGMLWLESKELRVIYGIEKEDGTKENLNVLRHDEIVELVQGNYKKLEKSIDEITESTILSQFVEVARELKIDSKAKIDIIEKATGATIYEEE